MGLIPSIYKRKVGDLGVAMADSNGKAEFAISDALVSLVGPRSVIGRSIVIKNADGQTQNEELKMGCGVIGFSG